MAVGAATQQHVIESDPLIQAKVPLLAKVMPLVGHSATRARGTVGGSIANGDAAAEIVLGGGDARGNAGLAGERRRPRDAGRRVLLRPHGDVAAADGMSQVGQLPGLAGAAGGCRLPRGQCATERFRLRLGRGTARARCRRPCTSAPRRSRRRDGRADAARCGGDALVGRTFDEAQSPGGDQGRARRRRDDGRSPCLGRLSPPRRRHHGRARGRRRLSRSARRP